MDRNLRIEPEVRAAPDRAGAGSGPGEVRFGRTFAGFRGPERVAWARRPAVGDRRRRERRAPGIWTWNGREVCATSAIVPALRSFSSSSVALPTSARAMTRFWMGGSGGSIRLWPREKWRSSAAFMWGSGIGPGLEAGLCPSSNPICEMSWAAGCHPVGLAYANSGMRRWRYTGVGLYCSESIRTPSGVRALTYIAMSCPSC